MKQFLLAMMVVFFPTMSNAASVVINETRIVFPDSVTITVKNEMVTIRNSDNPECVIDTFRGVKVANLKCDDLGVTIISLDENGVSIKTTVFYNQKESVAKDSTGTIDLD